MQALMGPQQCALERAMRVWALTDETVAENVRKSDGRVFGAVYQAFVDAGFDQQDAGSDGRLLRGRDGRCCTAPTSNGRARRAEERFLDFMLRP